MMPLMSPALKPITDFLVNLGIEKIPHTEKSYLAHLIGVHRDLRGWGCPEEVCLVGMFHSIYGTEAFQGFKLPLERRGELAQMIGARAERLAYLNSAMDRGTFDANFTAERGPAAPFRWRDRITGRTEELSPADFDDLARIHLCDMLEQVARSNVWDHRRPAYRGMARWLGGVAEAEYQRVFAKEPRREPVA